MTRPPQIKGRGVGVMTWRQREIRAAKVTNVQTGERGKREDKTENIKKKKKYVYIYFLLEGFQGARGGLMKEGLSGWWKCRADDSHLRSRWRWGRGWWGGGKGSRVSALYRMWRVGGGGGVVVVAGIEIEASTDGDGMLRGAEVRRGLCREGKGHAEESHPTHPRPSLTSLLPACLHQPAAGSAALCSC